MKKFDEIVAVRLEVGEEDSTLGVIGKNPAPLLDTNRPPLCCWVPEVLPFRDKGR